ncbi:MAG: hypothetical protein SGI84_11265 [Gemmatimonadota bacterium]|nr:hypothetical protein [Gemmatimonadota bacterium]
MWAITGFVVGAATGWLLGEMTGGVSRARVSSYLTARKQPRPEPQQASAPRTRIQAALEADAELGGLSLTLVPAGRAAIELHGWVPSRRVRSRATRLAAVAAAPVRLVDCLLVRGEDDRPAAEPTPTAGSLQSA